LSRPIGGRGKIYFALAVYRTVCVDGWEATRRLKNNPDTRGIPVIALSAHALAGSREKALAAGCDEFDTKPVEFERLLGKIRDLLVR
jgi:two-component system cell cycle response regulator DivK